MNNEPAFIIASERQGVGSFQRSIIMSFTKVLSKNRASRQASIPVRCRLAKPAKLVSKKTRKTVFYPSKLAFCFSEIIVRALHWRIGERIQAFVGEDGDVGKLLLRKSEKGYKLSANTTVNGQIIGQGKYGPSRVAMMCEESFRSFLLRYAEIETDIFPNHSIEGVELLLDFNQLEEHNNE